MRSLRPAIERDVLSPMHRFFDCSLVAMLLSGFFALVSSGVLDGVTLTVTTAAFAARLALIATGKRLDLPPVLSNVAVILYAGFYPVDYFFISQDFLTATVRLICFLAIAKGLTVVSNRDALYAIVIGFAELLAAALLTSSLLFFVFLSLFLFAAVATLASWQIRLGPAQGSQLHLQNTPRFHWRLLSVSFAATAGIVAITVVMFFVLPRTARAALQNLVSSRYHLPGFSGSVKLGDIGTIQQSSRVMMHVKLEESAPERLPYKWRGAALTTFDGSRWSHSGGSLELLRFRYGSLRLPTRFHLERPGKRVRYHVQLSEGGLDSIFVIGVPEFLEANITLILRQSNGAIRTAGMSPSMLRYTASSFVDARGGDGAPEPGGEERRRLLDLPPLNARIAELTQQVTSGATGDWARARALEGWLQRSFEYTLEQPSESPADPLAHFLFERRKGHCEYFASSMAVMLRTVGIPSRVITGFQGGVRNPVSGWHVIHASDAHSWVEAWIPGNGWTIFDPTPATAGAPSFAFLDRMMHLADAADLFWQEWVMQYDIERQFRLATQFENAGPSRTIGPELLSRRDQIRDWFVRFGIGLVLLTALGVTVWMLYPHVLRMAADRKRKLRLASGGALASDATVLYVRLLERLRAQGIEKPAWYTPSEFSEIIKPPKLKTEVVLFTAAYSRFRFGHDAKAGRELLERFDRVEEALHHSATEPSA